MTSMLSNETIQAMGFREFSESEAISASFSSLTVYVARGIHLADGVTEVSGGKVAGVGYRLAVSASLNNACTALVADVFTDTEEDWKKEKKCQGPFVLVQLGPTQEYKCASGKIKIEEDGSTTTYDCFPSVRTELAQLELSALAPIVSGLTCVLNEAGRYVALRKIDRVSVGCTPAGVVVHDIRINVRGELYTSYKLASSQLAERLGLAKNLTSKLNPKASRFFALGLAEEDQLKKFLYFFLALEIETHAVFGQIDHAAALDKFVNGITAYGQSTVKLLQTKVDSLKNLYDRFVWCANCVWPHLNETDLLNSSCSRGREMT